MGLIFIKNNEIASRLRKEEAKMDRFYFDNDDYSISNKQATIEIFPENKNHVLVTCKSRNSPCKIEPGAQSIQLIAGNMI